MLATFGAANADDYIGAAHMVVTPNSSSMPGRPASRSNSRSPTTRTRRCSTKSKEGIHPVDAELRVTVAASAHLPTRLPMFPFAT